ncbi:hypothetical protein Pan44_10080 [Caulifigura coniformis]|uniref:Uncharacterized protein n=1 Tax=Caulifigura coniformis TaxID=2527983 RepID=A0A517SA56_9PLAN|nr:hypothetical protein [Caulifigura coniformis]QDT52993.1 hypothetical protein Pan44_10080 [Caulifigura coniformis]
MGLTLNQIRSLAAIVRKGIEAKGADFFKWIDPPKIEGQRITQPTSKDGAPVARELSLGEAFAVFDRKLNTVYCERFVLAICTAIAAANAGKDVALLQFQKEPHAPFDATGWVVLAIDGHPVFHISPADLPLNTVNDEGLVTVVEEGTETAHKYAWKNTTKVDEFGMLLDMLL